nr:hypothetical protein [Oscillospiraceae bacterium]
MSKINMSFFNAYKELDSACAKRLGISRGGVSAYIGRLVELKYVPERSDVLPRLIKYRKIRNILAHEENAFDRSFEITNSDVKWLSRLARRVERSSDPISRYERNTRFYSIWKRVRIAVFLLIALLLIISVIIILSNYGII